MGTRALLPIVALLFCQVDRIVCYNLTILHTNDIHAHMEQFNSNQTSCTADDIASRQCFGGMPRLRTKVEEIRSDANKNVLLLDAGGQFQGSLWFYAFGDSLISLVMNIILYDAMSPGNHEFDEGVSRLAAFVEAVRFSVVSCNMDRSNEPILENIRNYTTFRKGNQNVAVIGYTTPETADVSRPGNVTFRPEIESLRYVVEELERNGINKIIALGHSGFQMDKRIAESVPGIDVIVGGKTNTFLYTGVPPSDEVPEGPYPTVLMSPRNEAVVIVQNYAYGKYLGNLEVEFDDATGVVKAWNGNPILLDSSIQEEAFLLQQLEGYKTELMKIEQQTVSTSYVFLDGTPEKCRVEECNMGNLVADAMVRQNLRNQSDSWSEVAIAMLNGGGIRASIDIGPITTSDVVNVLPFKNTVDNVVLTGQTIWDTLEYSASKWADDGSLFGGFLQVSGLRITYDMHKPVNQRVADVQVVCTDCKIPEFYPINKTELYQVLMPSFLANGGDGYDVIRDNMVLRYSEGNLDFAILLAHVRSHRPVITGLDGRIRFLDSGKNTDPTIEDCPDSVTTLSWSSNLLWTLLAAFVFPSIISTL